MKQNRRPNKRPKGLLPLWALIFVLALCPEAFGFKTSDYNAFQSKIIDYQHRLNKSYPKVKRKKTAYIIVHTSELGLKSTLRVVSRGKRLKNGTSTPGGHANYVIARNGRVYRIMNKALRADHAGRSMWDGRTDISSVSIGIEFVGYHYAPLTGRQYRSAAMLIDILQKVYAIGDRAVLTHSQVAYGRPNPWFPGNHRGRKRCAKNFDRKRAGLGPTWTRDPDVLAGRLMPDPQLDQLFYRKTGAEERLAQASNIISTQNSAWSIAGGDYNSRTTVYLLPGGKRILGDRVGNTIGWRHLPVNTRVLLNQEETGQEQVPDHPVKRISSTMTAWSHAGQAYKRKTTFFFLPSGKSYPGSRISDWDDLPLNTRLIIGYQGPHEITKANTAFRISGPAYKSETTVYHFPSGQVITGDRVPDFSLLPQGTNVYLPM